MKVGGADVGGRVESKWGGSGVGRQKFSDICFCIYLPFRLLLTSSKAVRKLLRRNEMHGWNQRALDQEAHDQRVVANIRCVVHCSCYSK